MRHDLQSFGGLCDEFVCKYDREPCVDIHVSGKELGPDTHSSAGLDILPEQDPASPAADTGQSELGQPCPKSETKKDSKGE